PSSHHERHTRGVGIGDERADQGVACFDVLPHGVAGDLDLPEAFVILWSPRLAVEEVFTTGRVRRTVGPVAACGGSERGDDEHGRHQQAPDRDVHPHGVTLRPGSKPSRSPTSAGATTTSSLTARLTPT